MVRCGTRLELAWLGVVARDGAVLLDALVRPSEPVTDYLTQWSGVTATKLAGDNVMSLEAARDALFALIDANTLICGHSLENDLHALRLVHERVLDTAVLYPRASGAASRRVKHALRHLSRRYLGRAIQEGTSHSPLEDARAAMALAEQKLLRGTAHGVETGAVPSASESLFAALERAGVRSAVVDRPTLVRQFTVDSAAAAVACANDAAVRDALASPPKAPFVWAQLHALAELYTSCGEELRTEIDALDDAAPLPLPGTREAAIEMRRAADFGQCLKQLDDTAKGE